MKPQTTDYVLYRFEAYFMIESLWKNCINCFEVNLEERLPTFRMHDVVLKIYVKAVNTVLL